MNLHRANHILVWMRDGDLAAQLREGLENQGLPSTWAASLPEAIAAVDRCFPGEVACTLGAEAPSLMDLETLLTYLSIGHSNVSLPPIPIWAITEQPSQYAARIQDLDLPVRLLPLESGSEGLLAEIVHHLVSQGLLALRPQEELCSVLFVGPAPRAGFYLSRYLGARGIPMQPCETLDTALQVLEQGQFEVIVADLTSEQEALAFLGELRRNAPSLPIVVLAEPDGWLTRISPVDIPTSVSCALAKPVRAETLEVCLRRLLRIHDVVASSMPGCVRSSATIGLPPERA
ncbi:MAG: hypothetical protein KAY24_08445 [Candidatus Eisenbacteria sp.]|nr:hypothetical protein [Candidatus Eisenbacteria bacterium]